MIALLHVLAGAVTPHIGTIVTAVTGWFKARQAFQLAKLQTGNEIVTQMLKSDVEKYRVSHEHPTWSDQANSVTRLLIVLGVLGVFVWDELFAQGLDVSVRSNLTMYVIAHSLSSMSSYIALLPGLGGKK